MTTTTPLLVDTLASVQARVAEDTGWILYHAFRAANVECPNCKYIENAELYDRLLPRYIAASVEEHHARKRVEGSWLYPREFVSVSALQRLHRAEINLAALKTQIRPLRPCAVCRKRFNPTGRIRLSAPCLPRIKELFDD